VVAAILQEGCRGNPEFRSQLGEAAEAAAPLIAEGFARFTTGEFVRYLRLARGELAEVQTKLAQARTQGYFTVSQLSRAEPAVDHAMAVTTNLLKSKLRQLDAQRSQRRRQRKRR
jgi:four helix bundle protein